MRVEMGLLRFLRDETSRTMCSEQPYGVGTVKWSVGRWFKGTLTLRTVGLDCGRGGQHISSRVQ